MAVKQSVSQSVLPRICKNSKAGEIIIREKPLWVKLSEEQSLVQTYHGMVKKNPQWLKILYYCTSLYKDLLNFKFDKENSSKTDAQLGKLSSNKYMKKLDNKMLKFIAQIKANSFTLAD